MARQPEIQYIRPYTDGSAARQVELLPRRESKTRLPKVRKVKPLVIQVDLLALCAIVVAAVMLVMLVSGCVKLRQSRAEAVRLASYVSSLRNENAELKHEYQNGYDLETVERTALALGMVPVEDVTWVTLTGEEPEVEIRFYEPTFWEKVISFFDGLFA